MIAATLTLVLAAAVPALGAHGIVEDPCETVPRSIVGLVLGAPVVAAMVRGADAVTSCTIRTRRFYPYAVIGASRYATVALARRAFATRVADYAGSGRGRRQRTLGLADEAIGVVAAGAPSLLFVRKGTAIYVFEVVDGDGDGDGRHGATQNARLAKRVLPSIQSGR